MCLLRFQCNFKSFDYIQENTNLITFIRDAWIVSQYKNEYNPMHNHVGSEISSVIYLNVPNTKVRRNINSKKGKKDYDGYIEFFYSAGSRDSDIFENGKLAITPFNGLMILFSSFLFHSVYPFIGEGERRSIALNASYRILQNLGNNSKRLIAGNQAFFADNSMPYKTFKRE